jgi:hypothetical protein
MQQEGISPFCWFLLAHIWGKLLVFFRKHTFLGTKFPFSKKRKPLPLPPYL